MLNSIPKHNIKIIAGDVNLNSTKIMSNGHFTKPQTKMVST